MPFTNGDIAKVDLRWQVGSIGFAANVFQAKLTQSTPHDIADADVLLDMGDWMTDLLEPIEPHVVVSCVVFYCAVYKKVGLLWNLVGPADVAFTSASIDDPLPSGVAALITAATTTSKVLGKKYIVGFAEAAQTAGLWIAGVLAAMLEMAVIWGTPFTALSDPTSIWQPGVWSTKLAGFKAFEGFVIARDVPAYQRRRKQGVGI